MKKNYVYCLQQQFIKLSLFLAAFIVGKVIGQAYDIEPMNIFPLNALTFCVFYLLVGSVYAYVVQDNDKQNSHNFVKN